MGCNRAADKGNILNMSDPRQWLELGLDTLPPDQADRVRLFRSLCAASAMLRGRLDRAMASVAGAGEPEPLDALLARRDALMLAVA